MAVTVMVGAPIFANLAVANLDAKYGPYSSKLEAFDTLGVDGDDVLAIGLTVGIVEDGHIVEYWFQSSIDSADDLVPKIPFVGTPASDNYVPTLYYQEGDEIPNGKNIGDVKTELIGTAPTGLFETIYSLEARIKALEATDFTTEDLDD